MKLSKTLYLQEGGAMPMDPAMGGAEAAPAPMESEQPAAEDEMAAQLEEVAAQLLDSLLQQIGDPNVVGQILQIALEMLSQAAAPAPAEPTFQKMGGKVVRIS